MNSSTLKACIQKSGKLLSKRIAINGIPLEKRKYAANAKTCFEQVKALNEFKTKPATHVIFGLDGVVLDTIRPIEDAHENYLMRYKKSLNKKLKVDLMGRRTVDIGQVVVQELNLPIDAPVYSNGVWQFQREYFRKNKVKQMKGIEELLCYFKENNIPRALVVGCNKKSFQYKIRRHPGLLDLFCHVVLVEDVERGAPHPDLYFAAAKKFRYAPKDMEKYIVIESTLSGIQAAKAAGMQTVFYPDKSVPTNLYKQGDMYITHLNDFDPNAFTMPVRKKL